MRHGTALLALFIFLLPAGTVLGKGTDQIIKADGTVLKDVEIVRENYEKIVYRHKGSRVEDSPALIREIVHGDAPPIYSQAEGARLAGRYEAAIEAFKKAGELKKPKWLGPYVSFSLAETYRVAGDADRALLDKAAEAYQKFIKKNSKHLLIPRAIYGLADTFRRKDQYSDAKSQFDKLVEGKFGDRWQLWGKYGKGLTNLTSGANSQAIEEFTTLVDRAGTKKEFRNLVILANLGKGRAFIQEKRFDDAVRFFKRLIERERGAERVIAGAYVGLGDCFLKQSSSEDNKRRALFYYLHVVMLYPGAGEEYATALYKAAKLQKQLGNPSAARGLKDELKRCCPGSRWAKMD
jgi:tetratricopeptide (TPR) repeat protein